MNKTDLDKLKNKARQVEVVGIITITLTVVMAIAHLFAGNWYVAFLEIMLGASVFLLMWGSRLIMKLWDLIHHLDNK